MSIRVSAFRGKLRAASAAVRQHVAAELYQQAEAVMADSKEHKAPATPGRSAV